MAGVLIGLLARTIRDAAEDDRPGAAHNTPPSLRSRDHDVSHEGPMMAPRSRSSRRGEQRSLRAEQRADRWAARTERWSERRSEGRFGSSGREQQRNHSGDFGTSQYHQQRQHQPPPPLEQSYGYQSPTSGSSRAGPAGAATLPRGMQGTKGPNAAHAAAGTHHTGGPSDDNVLPDEAPPPSYEESQRGHRV
ncbi:hypothetical protein N3K66_005744 [Trichothecium roseum]|uniref:Uncharacterized protein n=1 Tax=Trichothecium roseum TaxID=47278 RepID=A0ACC0V036_9HYPO|nr:hypothetical protein N3K66_005744 [Trichothecium roseum]